MSKGSLEDRQKYTTGDLAELLQTSRRTIARYIGQGKIRARRTVGGWQIVPRDEVLNFLWEAGFDRSIPPIIRVSAARAYERMSAPIPAPEEPKRVARKRR